MKILFIGNARNYLLIELAKKLQVIDGSIQIDILTDQSAFEEHPFHEVFRVEQGKGIWSRNYFKSLHLFFTLRRALGKVPSHYDFLHIFLVVPTYRLLWGRICSLANKRILTFFGSEYYRSNFLYRILTQGMIKRATWVTASNQQTLDDVCNYYGVGSGKRKLCRFGLSVLDEIDRIEFEDVWKPSVAFGIPEDAIAISVGYNAATIQNHVQILDELSVCREQLPKFIICFQFHGQRTTYVAEIISETERYGLPYTIIDSLDDRSLAIYRKRIDICIQLQKTDQFSGAMQEHLYAGSRVITGTWLPYKVLDDAGADYCRLHAISELHKVLPEIVDWQPDMRNKEIIKSISSWEKTVRSWHDLYRSA